jgi:hypothetical protein
MGRITYIALAALALSTTAGCTAQLGARSNLHASAFGAGAGGPPATAVGSGVSASVEVRVSFFGVPLDGADDVVFVLDRSGSMGLVSAGVAGGAVGMSKGESAVASLAGSLVNHAAGNPLPNKLEAAQDELINTLYAMPDGTTFGVIFFDDEINALSPEMWVLTPDSRARAEAFIRGIEPGGSTAAVPAMNLAYRMGARRIVLLSDGLANNGGNGDDLLRDARVAMDMGLRIDTVGLGLDQDDALLQTLAIESGGMAVMR